MLLRNRFYEAWRWREATHLLSHPGQSALASGFQAASRGGHSRSSWLRPGGRPHRTRPGSMRRLYQSLTAPWEQTLDDEAAELTDCTIAAVFGAQSSFKMD